MTEKTVLALVKKHPGRTSSELARLAHRGYERATPGQKYKMRSGMNGMLRALAERNRLNRFHEAGMNPKVKALRHYPICTVLNGTWSPYREPITISVLTEKRPFGCPPVDFQEFVNWLQQPVPQYQHTTDATDRFADFIIAQMPRFKPANVRRILAAAATQRLLNHS